MIAANSLAFFADIVPGVILEHKEIYATEKTFKFSFHNRKVAIAVSVENNYCVLTYVCDNGFRQVSDSAELATQDIPATIVAIVNDYMTA